MREVSKKYWRKFEINFRKIAIKLLKQNFNPNVYGKYLFATFIISYLLLHTENTLKRYLWLQMWKYTIASASYTYTQRAKQDMPHLITKSWCVHIKLWKQYYNFRHTLCFMLHSSLTCILFHEKAPPFYYLYSRYIYMRIVAGII